MRLTDPPVCPTCAQPLRTGQSFVFSPGQGTAEHLGCVLRRLVVGIPAGTDALPTRAV
jgi:hypothetical protein